MRERPLSPHLQVYRWPLSMALSILHRASGVALTAGLLLIVWWLMAVAAGGESYAMLVACVSSWPGQLLLLGWTLALVFHLFSGLRHLMWDAGRGYDKPTTQATGWAVLGATVVVTAALWWLARAGLA